jgi:hypothetical protein
VRFRIRVAVIVLAGFAVLLGTEPGSCQTAPIQNPGAIPALPEDILRELAPDNVPPPKLTLKPAARARAIRLLAAAKRDETGWHRQLAIYLLATLGYGYERNRDELLRVWHKDGDDGTMELLIRLYGQGHEEFLQPLLFGYNGYNAATSEGLGTFYGDLLARNPNDFLAALTTFPVRKQMSLCTAAGEADGGGMNPKTERKVLANLKAIGGELAERCARGVRLGNRYGDEATQQEQQEIQKEAQDKPKKQ